MRLVAWLDRHLTALCSVALGAALVLLACGFLVIATGCGADPGLYDDRDPTSTVNECGETGACQP